MATLTTSEPVSSTEAASDSPTEPPELPPAVPVELLPLALEAKLPLEAAIPASAKDAASSDGDARSPPLLDPVIPAPPLSASLDIGGMGCGLRSHAWKAAPVAKIATASQLRVTVDANRMPPHGRCIRSAIRVWHEMPAFFAKIPADAVTVGATWHTSLRWLSLCASRPLAI